jgi:SET domain
MTSLLTLLLTNQFSSCSWNPLCSILLSKDSWLVYLKWFSDFSVIPNPDERYVHEQLCDKIPKKGQVTDIVFVFSSSDISLLMEAVQCGTDLWLSILKGDTAPIIFQALGQMFPAAKTCHLLKDDRLGFMKITHVLESKKNQTEIKQHWESDDFYVAESRCPNGGLGLFSKKQIVRGEILFEFKGKAYPLSDFELLEDNKRLEYAITAESHNGEKWVFDPTCDSRFDVTIAQKTENWAPFINEPPLGMIANVESVAVSSPVVQLHLDIVATRTIEPEDEIYMVYHRDKSQYDIGADCPHPPSVTYKRKTSEAKKGTMICIGMTPSDNLHHTRVVSLLEQGWKVVTLSNRYVANTDSSQWHNLQGCNHVYMEDQDMFVSVLKREVKKAKGEVRVLFDYVSPFHNEKLFQTHLLEDLIDKCGAKCVILPVFFNETFQWTEWLTRYPQKCSFTLADRSNCQIPFQSTYFCQNTNHFANLCSPWPFCVVTKSERLQKPLLFTYSAEDIITNMNIGDVETVQWLAKYSSGEKNLHKKCNQTIKNKTYQFLESLFFRETFK